jgi:hypothetical protein
MQYLLLIYEDERVMQARATDERARHTGAFRELSRRLVASGELQGGQPLESVATATSVRVRDGRTLLTDGPFAETREQLGGFYLIDAPDLDRALAIAAEIPTAKTGTIEVRPIANLGS